MIQHRTGSHQPWSGRDRRRLPLAALATLALVLLLAGCGTTVTGTAAAAATTSLDVAPSAQALQQQFVSVVKQVGPAVVLIRTSEGLGSGIVFDAKGDIVTNDHVVDSASNFQVTLANGKQYRARPVGSFPADDLAVLHVDAAGLHPAAFADSSRLEVGDVALAIGNPLGLQSSVTEGIVSALGRTVNEDNGVALPNVIQTSAAINPGNSGGALVDLQGQVIGIPTLAATDPQLGSGQAPGIGFAIPSNTVGDIATQLIGQGKVTNSRRAYLGVEVAATTAGGLLVTQAQAGGPAAKAGIRTGELIAAVNGRPTPDQATLADVLAGLNPRPPGHRAGVPAHRARRADVRAGLTPGQHVNVAVVRSDGARRTVRVTLGQYPG